MGFLNRKVVFLLLLLTVVSSIESRSNDAENWPITKNVFKFRHMNQCRRNEYYDLDYFTCLPCDENDSNLVQSFDKFSCQCAPTSITIALYDSARRRPVCVDICPSSPFDHEDQSETPKSPNKNTETTKICLPAPSETKAKIKCTYKYVNLTSEPSPGYQNGSPTPTRITTENPDVDNNCTYCDMKYNFHYRGYCISNELLKPYLNYNSFWQQTSITGHFGDLKFVAFFCLGLHNATACNQLANLCVISHYSFDKNSPCSAFLLTQASESLLRYSHLEEQLQMVRPFMFYRKGKQTTKMLSEPVRGAVYKNAAANHKNQFLRFFATVYATDGALKRWGSFHSDHVNLCQLHTQGGGAGGAEEFQFGTRREETSCRLSLENLIDLASIYGNDNFMSVFLNFTSEKNPDRILMQNVPILIESLSQENQRPEMEEWQLVKRFQMIEAHGRHNLGHHVTHYEDDHKLLLYRMIRYVEKFEIHYGILENNRITIPIIKLRYRTIELRANSSLDNVYTFRFQVNFTRPSEVSGSQWFNNLLFAVFLLIAMSMTILRTYNYTRRHPQASSVECCDLSSMTEFLLQLISNVANAFLCFFIVRIGFKSLVYLLTQRDETIVLLPIAEDRLTLDMLIYAALILKGIYLCIHFWRMAHIDIFFIDWERPRACDNNHFNLKSNLETSSVCSSVRTFISESNVSAWRTFFIANEWIELSATRKTSIFIQGLLFFLYFETMNDESVVRQDPTIQLFVCVVVYLCIHLGQLFLRHLLVDRIFGNPLQKFVDICSLANISVFTLLESSYGFYIHGRSPHGFSDTDISAMVMQLQRESQNMCGRRGLLSDSDYQTYIILPPINLRTYCENLLIPFKKSCNLSQAHLKKEAFNIESNLEKTSVAYNSVNRFFCAFIDHAIRDMDYIIKEKSFIEKVLKSEFDNYLTNNKGTFYIDTNSAFSQLFLFGNHAEILIMDLLMLLTLYTATANLSATIAIICLLNKLFQYGYRHFVRQNVAEKTLVDKCFLI